MYRTAIIPISTLPEDTSRTEDEEGGLVSVYVHLGSAYAELRRIDHNTAVRSSTLHGPIEDHLAGFEVVN